jgi:hypothetical protein
MATEKGTKVIALNTILRTLKPGVHGDKAKGIPATKPEVQEIKPGTTFMSSGKELEALRAAGSVRDWSAEDARILNNLSNVIGEFETEDEGEGDSTASTKTTTKTSGKSTKDKAAASSTDNVV